MHCKTWFGVAIATCCFGALNLHAWDPGVGGRRPPKPPGTELERYFGWPTSYRAEWWNSDDPGLMMRILEVAPFYYPSDEMTLQVRYLGLGAMAVDLLFAVLAVVGIGLMIESVLRERWHLWNAAVVVSIVLALIGLHAVAGRFAVHL